MPTADHVLAGRDALQASVAAARRALAMAEAIAGPEAVGSAALGQIILPRLQTAGASIEMALDERERAEHFQLKLVKRARMAKRGASS